jgi:hypothetical protein
MSIPPIVRPATHRAKLLAVARARPTPVAPSATSATMSASSGDRIAAIIGRSAPRKPQMLATNVWPTTFVRARRLRAVAAKALPRGRFSYRPRSTRSSRASAYSAMKNANAPDTATNAATLSARLSWIRSSSSSACPARSSAFSRPSETLSTKDSRCSALATQRSTRFTVFERPTQSRDRPRRARRCCAQRRRRARLPELPRLGRCLDLRA